MLKHKELIGQIINAFYEVYNCLGYGFLEKVYENALLKEFLNRGIKADVQRAIDVFYKGSSVGRYYADLIVENNVIVELKAIDQIDERHGYQLINYLKSTEIEVGLLLNFGKEPEFMRKVFLNNNFNENRNQTV